MRCAEALDSDDAARDRQQTTSSGTASSAIEPLGPQPVYDATVKGTHNFIADGIIAHNSIEQDTDVVILLHREDAYERESPRAGEADLIVAKHRNGPTAHGDGRIPGPLLAIRGHGERVSRRQALLFPGIRCPRHSLIAREVRH